MFRVRVGKNSSSLERNTMRIAKICGYCGIQYFRIKSRAEKSRACSLACHNKLMPTYRDVWNKGTAKISTENELFRKSKAYKDWRTAVYERDDFTCKECGSRGGRLNADHIKPFAIFKELRLEISNGRTLCERCHRKTPTYGWGTYHMKYA